MILCQFLFFTSRGPPPPPLQAAGTQYLVMDDFDMEVPAVGARPACLAEPRGAAQLVCHCGWHKDLLPLVQVLAAPVPQMVDAVPVTGWILQRTLKQTRDYDVEQLIEVPKLSTQTRVSRVLSRADRRSVTSQLLVGTLQHPQRLEFRMRRPLGTGLLRTLMRSCREEAAHGRQELPSRELCRGPRTSEVIPILWMTTTQYGAVSQVRLMIAVGTGHKHCPMVSAMSARLLAQRVDQACPGGSVVDEVLRTRIPDLGTSVSLLVRYRNSAQRCGHLCCPLLLREHISHNTHTQRQHTQNTHTHTHHTHITHNTNHTPHNTTQHNTTTTTNHLNH